MTSLSRPTDAHNRLQAALMDARLAPYVSGSTEPWTVSVLCGLIHVMRPRIILELGTFEGLTTLAIANVLSPTQHLVSVEHDETRAAKARALVGARANVQIIQHDAIAFLKRTQDAMYDFAFVDDDHAYEHVKEEIALLHRVVRPGGLITMHDVIGDFGLGRIVHEHGGVIMELPLLHADGGLGVIRV